MTEVRFYWQSFSGSPAILERRSVASGSSKEMDPRDEERVCAGGATHPHVLGQPWRSLHAQMEEDDVHDGIRGIPK